jgi:hypothetical protein
MEAAAAAAAALRSPTAAAAPTRRLGATRGAGPSSLPFERSRRFAFGSIKVLDHCRLFGFQYYKLWAGSYLLSSVLIHFLDYQVFLQTILVTALIILQFACI